MIFKINREVEVVEMKGLGFQRSRGRVPFLRAVEFYGLGEVFKIKGKVHFQKIVVVIFKIGDF